LNKLEKEALRYTKKHGRPPVMILNNVHFFHNDEEGRNMLLQLQQRAEAWAAGGKSHNFVWVISAHSSLRDPHYGVQQVGPRSRFYCW